MSSASIFTNGCASRGTSKSVVAFAFHRRRHGTAIRRPAYPKTSASRSRVLRASVRIFLEADEQGRFRRRVGCPPSTPAWFGPILTLYLRFVQDTSRTARRKRRGSTSKSYRCSLSIWRAPASPNSVASRRGHVREFYENAAHGVPRRSYGSTLRVFFRWAAVQGWLADSLGDAVPRPRQYRYVNLPDVLSPAEVDRILAAVDQIDRPRPPRLCDPFAGGPLRLAPLRYSTADSG